MTVSVLAVARMAAVREPHPENKARVIYAKRKLDIIGAAISARREQKSILQTLTRAVPT